MIKYKYTKDCPQHGEWSVQISAHSHKRGGGGGRSGREYPDICLHLQRRWISRVKNIESFTCKLHIDKYVINNVVVKTIQKMTHSNVAPERCTFLWFCFGFLIWFFFWFLRSYYHCSSLKQIRNNKCKIKENIELLTYWIIPLGYDSLLLHYSLS